MNEITRGAPQDDSAATMSGTGAIVGLRAYCDHNSKMRESTDITKIAPALVRVQAAIENPARNRSVQVRTQAGAYTFRYATLDKIIDMTRRVLAENGLCVLQPIVSTERGPALVTRLLHESGQWMECEVGLPGLGSNPQAFGSVVTYVRRYSICAMLNIAADEDDDANRAAGHHYQDMPARGGSAAARDRATAGTRGGERAEAATPTLGGPTEIGEVVGEAVARVLVNRARLAEGVAEGHALLEDWTRRMAVLEQLRGTKAWDALEREIGSGLKRSLGTEPAAAFVAALRATTPEHVQALQQHWEGKWAETLSAMQAEAPATYALLRRHVAAQIARVRGATDNARPAAAARTEDKAAGGASSDEEDAPAAAASSRRGTGGRQGGGGGGGEAPANAAGAAGFASTLKDADGNLVSDPISDPVAFAQAYAEAWHATEPEARGNLARQNVKALGQAARHAPARQVLNELTTETAGA
jgi:hypothetical protein